MAEGATSNVKKSVTRKKKRRFLNKDESDALFDAEFLVGTWVISGDKHQRVTVARAAPEIGASLLIVHPEKGPSVHTVSALLKNSKMYYSGQIGKALVSEVVVQAGMRMSMSMVKWGNGDVWKKMHSLSKKSSQARTDAVGGASIEVAVNGKPALVMHPTGVCALTDGGGWTSARTALELAALKVPFEVSPALAGACKNLLTLTGVAAAPAASGSNSSASEVGKIRSELEASRLEAAKWAKR